MFQIDRDDLHASLCEALGVNAGWGSKVAVCRALDVRPEWYNRVLRGEGSLDQIGGWCMKAGIRLIVEPQDDGNGAVRFEVVHPD